MAPAYLASNLLFAIAIIEVRSQVQPRVVLTGPLFQGQVKEVKQYEVKDYKRYSRDI